MIAYQNCTRCGKFDLTGTKACSDEQLCPACVAEDFGVTEEEVRATLVLRLLTKEGSYQQLYGKGGDTNGNRS